MLWNDVFFVVLIFVLLFRGFLLLDFSYRYGALSLLKSCSWSDVWCIFGCSLFNFEPFVFFVKLYLIFLQLWDSVLQVFGFLVEIGLHLRVFGLFFFELHEVLGFLFFGNFQLVFKIVDSELEVVFLFLKLLLELKTSVLSFGFEKIYLTEKFLFILLPVRHSFVKLDLKGISSLSFQGKCFSELFGLVIILFAHFIQLSCLDFNSLVGFHYFCFIVLLDSHSDLLLSGFVFGGIRSFALFQAIDFHLKLSVPCCILGLLILPFVNFVLQFVL